MWFKRTPQKILGQASARAAVVELERRIDPARSFQELTRPEQVLILLSQLRSETLNGTVDQYLANSSGDNFADALAALREIQASECAQLLEEMASWFPGGQPAQNRMTRGEQLSKMENERPQHESDVRRVSDQLTNAFPRMLKQLVTYLRDHVAEIR
ncbi:hypothetical protein AYO49_00710 [Verrucomicrobiaceae bacterium SCGC AG-212-N21]|nr:hypothetical protein AYO49_00710 [Verrucomicrobiaceae bacterium SCGC AG-212-N21]